MRVQIPDHQQVREIIVSHHCLLRFRERARIRTSGVEALNAQLRVVLAEVEISAVTPAWVSGEYDTPLWALSGEFAFPLTPVGVSGSYLARTCLLRPC